jgi:GNAT superfamily N-acetyltransferase
MVSLVKIVEWPGPAMDPLVEEATQEGFCFMSRLKDDWLCGANQFSGQGEALFGAFEAGRLVAIGGINRQSDTCGRLRRVYVIRTHRRTGIGRKLVRHLLDFASNYYTRVVLRTDSEAAGRFYAALGFFPEQAEGGSTHVLEIRNMLKTTL